MTVWVSIGNSDNKLTQRQWSSFCKSVETLIEHNSNVLIVAVAHSLPNSAFQNAHWAFDMPAVVPPSTKDAVYAEIKVRLTELARLWDQNHIAWTEGDTEFIKGVARA